VSNAKLLYMVLMDMEDVGDSCGFNLVDPRCQPTVGFLCHVHDAQITTKGKQRTVA